MHAKSTIAWANWIDKADSAAHAQQYFKIVALGLSKTQKRCWLVEKADTIT